jgi:hypothetical protein
MTWFVLQTAAAAALTIPLLLTYRWMRARAPEAAWLYAAGAGARVVVGLGFALSWLGSAAPADRLAADARWFPDAQMYYQEATHAADYGLTAYSDGEASPTFVRGLALWMRLAGPTHATVHLLNLLVLAGVCAAVVGAVQPRESSGRRAAALAVGAIALSPNLIILASQPLKDTLFFGALALVILGLWHVMIDDRRLRLAAVPLAAVLLGSYLMGGMRVYYALLILALLGAVLGLQGVRLAVGARRMPWRFAAGAAVLLLTVWAGSRLGGGPYYVSLVDPVTAPIEARAGAAINAVRLRLGLDVPPPPARAAGGGALDLIERSRRGFELTGGGTNMVPPELDRSRRTGMASRIRGVLLGLGAVFVPITVLRATGLVSFPGGGRMLLLTDIDTLVLDGSIAACLYFVWCHRERIRGRWPLVVLIAALGVISSLLVGYVVTNYGTLFRLRLIAAVPLWLLPVTLSRVPDGDAPHPSTIGSGVR